MIEFFTSKELVNELISRSTFTGIVIWSEEEQKSSEQLHHSFRVDATINIPSIKRVIALVDEEFSDIPD